MTRNIKKRCLNSAHFPHNNIVNHKKRKKNKFPKWKLQLQKIIFQSKTKAGVAFDIGLVVTILSSVALVMADSIQQINQIYGKEIIILEWGFTLLFTIEYVLRLICLRYPKRYANSFFGWIDLMAILPTYLSIFFHAYHFMIILRILRFLLIFRVLKLIHYVSDAQILIESFKSMRRKIVVFFFTIFNLVIIFGSLMYVIENHTNGFENIPKSIYWAVVTLTTVGYGNVYPVTILGKFISSTVMILGYSMIAVPAGLVVVEMGKYKTSANHPCDSCSYENKDQYAQFCNNCGSKLNI